MESKRSNFPCPMIIGKRPTQRTEAAHLIHEQSQRGYARDRDARARIVDAGNDPAEGVGRGNVRPGGVKTR